MMGVGTSFAGTAAGAVRFPVPATPAHRREPIALEPVRRVEPAAARPGGGRLAAGAPANDDAPRRDAAPAPLPAPPDAGRRGADAPGRASTPFVAQYIGQRLARGPVGRDWGEVSVAYRATVARGVTYLGFEAPLDLSV